MCASGREPLVTPGDAVLNAPMRAVFTILAVATAVVWPSESRAHDGSLDELGCHENRRWGGYHCHEGPLAGQYFRSKPEAVKLYPRRRDFLDRRFRPEGSENRFHNPTEVIRGRARVIDGDTIEIEGRRIGLFGIDAPEINQRCRDDRRRYRCGRRAAKELGDRIGKRRISCHRMDEGRARRITAQCWDGSTDLGAWMVVNGWALADRRRGEAYALHEDEARRRNRGIWPGAFEAPWHWRERRRERRRNR